MNGRMRAGFGLGLIFTASLQAVPVAAQPPSSEFQELPGRVRVGETVWVTGEDGIRLRGKLWRLSASSLEVLSRGQTKRFPADAVRAVWARKPDSLANGALIGLGVGVGFSALVALSADNSDDYVPWLAALFYGGIGAGVGVGVDAMVPGSKVQVFKRAPIAGGRVSATPLVTSRCQGVALRIAF